MSKIKKVFKNWRIIMLICFLVLALVAIRPNPFVEGVSIKAIEKNSSASLAGIEPPKPGGSPMSKERIISMNNVPISTVQDYYDFVKALEPNRTVRVQTNKNTYKLTTKEKFRIDVLNETEKKVVHETIQVNKTVDNETILVNKTINKTILVNKTKVIPLGTEDLGFSIAAAPTSNLRKGLDLQGGTRVLLQPEEKVSDDVLSTMIDSMKERLNVYGLTDVLVTEVRDKPKLLGEGNKYILVEIAGATEEEVKDLLSKQGKFESKISNTTVFKGGDDITYVCRTAECSGIDPNRGCNRVQGEQGWACGFTFSISLNPVAAQRQADATKNLPIKTENGEKYLTEQIVLYLDDQEVDRLNVAADLKGRAVTEIAISGSGIGTTEQTAMFDALKNMKRLQTILITGSLPVKLTVVKIDNVSPFLGVQFLKNAVYMGLLATIAVALVIYIRYRKFSIALPMMINIASEIVLLLGFAGLVGWNLDLSSIAGIILTVGTGVNQLIIIADETMQKKTDTESYSNWKEKIGRAFFVIMVSYATTLVAMVPLIFAGAGLLKGFALTTIAGETIGVLIARPAYAAIVQILLGEE